MVLCAATATLAPGGDRVAAVLVAALLPRLNAITSMAGATRLTNSTYASTVIGSRTRWTRGGRAAARARTSGLAEQKYYEARHADGARLHRDRPAEDKGIRSPATIA